MNDTLTQAAEYCLQKIRENCSEFETCFPSSQSRNYFYEKTGCTDWTESFWTGILWLSYEMTGEELFRETAEKQLPIFAERMAKRINVETHDLGFLYSLSCVAAYKLTGNEAAKKTALAAADCLLERFHEKGGFLQAWGSLNEPGNYRLIIDCLMNIPLLYWAHEATGNPEYREKAESHLHATLKTIVREDASTFHTFFFHPETGEPDHGETNQGFSDDSCWARGQAWAVYGLALSYRYTKAPEILPLWKRVTQYFVEHLPADSVPYWDLCFVDGNEPRDTSSAAIAVCGILEMNCLVPGAGFEAEGDQMLESLAKNYTTRNMASNGLLKDGMYGRPRGDQSECNIWGDYFFMEALVRKQKDWDPYW